MCHWEKETEALPCVRQVYIYIHLDGWIPGPILRYYYSLTPSIPAGQRKGRNLYKVSLTVGPRTELALKPWCPAFQARAPPCPGCLTGWGPVPEGPVLCLSLPGTPLWAAPSSHRLRATTTRWGVGARSGSAFTSLCALPCGR